MPGYRLRGKHFLITWSQVDWGVTWDDVQALLVGPIGATAYSVGREHHADGGIHFHAYVAYDRSQDRTIRDQWDLSGQHPNIKAKRSKPEQESAHTYTKKDGDFIEYGWDTYETGTSDLVAKAKSSPNFGAFIQWGYDNDVPFAYISAAWSAGSQSDATLIEGADVEGTISSTRLQFMVFDQSTRRALVLLGPTGLGKTVWAKTHAPRPSLFVRHIDQLKQFRRGFHKSIIFDDMDFKGDERGRGGWPRTSQIALVDFDNDSAIHTRYTPSLIPANTFKIFTCNEYPFTDDPAIERRVYVETLE